MLKLPYEYVAQEVDKLYEKSFKTLNESDLEGINKQCDFIRAFIVACGWTEDQFIRMTMGFEVVTEPTKQDLN